MTATRNALLAALEAGPVDGESLAGRLGVPSSAVREAVDGLREEGFEIEATDEGYEVRGVPEYGEAAIAFGLDAPFTVEYHDRLGSSNDRALDLAREGASDVVVVADEQTSPRGRLDREWSSPPGGVWFSVLLRPELAPEEVPVLTLAMAVAVTRACREAGVDAHIKWPNDVLVGEPNDGQSAATAGAAANEASDWAADRGAPKLAGILTEVGTDAGGVDWLVVGVGLNANVDPGALPPGATSLRALLGRDVERRLVLQRVIEEFHRLRGSPGAVLPAWREHARTLGRRVRVETPGGTFEGEAVDVAFPGTLILRTADGERRVSAGDCEHLRPV